ncbi:DUF305 domain-containing protein [Knoellia koreensis]|uniref:DUF305 domain-containing protein n=1 Tax=Knoellia koreensis TaxID=2730921 RepID=A0A849HMU3_9MICO|nr:DUF305 domain-containing protein [Knoellia sp. DB2414S]
MNRALRTLTVPAAAVAVLALSACGNGDSPDSMGSMSGQGSMGSTSSVTTAAQQNEADVSFATGMIPHHQQAVQMADLALKQSSTQEVKSLATKIKQAQDHEIQTMSSWLKAWGKPVPTGMSGGMEGMSMDGMMTEQEMNELAKATDVAFDRMWLTMMVKHHQGAVKMAETEVANGQNADAKRLAQEIIRAQNAEITEMTRLLNGAQG